MPDAPGLELLRGEIERDLPGAVLDTSFDRERAVLIADPTRILDLLGWLREAPAHRYRFLSSLHCADYYPAEPRFGIHYELLNRDRVERLRVKAILADPAAGEGSAPDRLGQVGSSTGETTTQPARQASRSGDLLPSIDSCVHLFPTANFQEREVFDFFGIVFQGHPDLTRILLPDDYVGWPQRRDFPIGGEPVTFTYNERAHG